jgi:hypothetical protein
LYARYSASPSRDPGTFYIEGHHGKITVVIANIRCNEAAWLHQVRFPITRHVRGDIRRRFEGVTALFLAQSSSEIYICEPGDWSSMILGPPGSLPREALALTGVPDGIFPVR